jgi:hypothetical protein
MNNKWIVDKSSKPKLLLYNVMQRDLPFLGINFLLNSICKKSATICVYLPTNQWRKSQYLLVPKHHSLLLLSQLQEHFNLRLLKVDCLIRMIQLHYPNQTKSLQNKLVWYNRFNIFKPYEIKFIKYNFKKIMFYQTP